MARNNPVTIWTPKQRPKREPKFHHAEIFEGAGRSTSALFAILNKGWFLRIGIVISLKKGVKAQKNYLWPLQLQ